MGETVIMVVKTCGFQVVSTVAEEIGEEMKGGDGKRRGGAIEVDGGSNGANRTIKVENRQQVDGTDLEVTRAHV